MGPSVMYYTQQRDGLIESRVHLIIPQQPDANHIWCNNRVTPQLWKLFPLRSHLNRRPHITSGKRKRGGGGMKTRTFKWQHQLRAEPTRPQERYKSTSPYEMDAIRLTTNFRNFLTNRMEKIKMCSLLVWWPPEMRILLRANCKPELVYGGG